MKNQIVSSIVFFFLLFGGVVLGQETQIRYLSGVDKDNTVDWEFYIDRGMNSGKWTTIAVPSNWELQGFGVYNYGRGKQPESDETGQYKYTFDVPETWKGMSVDIVFEGSMTDTYVKINGKEAGPVHQGSFYRFKYDISKLLQYGEENLLEVTVKNWSDNQSVNKAERQADFWVFGGIYRPVYLEAHPQQHIDWTAIDAKADGKFSAHLYLENNRNLTKATGQIQTLDGENVGEAFEMDISKRSEKVTLTTSIDNPKTWTPEFPNRYQVVFTVYDKNGNVHEVTEKFGFRTVELRPQDGFYVNGVKVRFKGVNRHSSWPESGRTTSRELSVIDVNLMKEMNMNAVRMSHYPPDKHFLEVCDSIGLFVIDELTGWQDAYDTLLGEKLVKELVVRDVNHPCVVIWANGNEGGNNHDLVDDYHLYDPQKRVVIHPWAIFNDTDTKHYKPWNCCTNSLFHGQEVFFPTEFLHGLYDGGHGAGLEDTWELMMENPLSAGIFLWVFADEGILRRDENDRMDTNKSNAPDGIVGPYREKEGSFFTIKELWSPIQPILPNIHSSTFDGEMLLENNYHYTNTSQCRLEWALVNFDDYRVDVPTAQVMEGGELTNTDIAPGDVGKVQLDLPESWRQYDALYFTAIDPHGRELYTWTWGITKPQEMVERMIGGGSEAEILTEQGDAVPIEKSDPVLRSGDVEVTLDSETGLITQVISKGEEISFSNGPVADTVFGLTTVEDIVVGTGELGQKVEVHFASGRKQVMRKLVYEMTSTGLLHIEAEYLPNGGHYDYVGLNFDYPEEQVTGVRWLGNGPYRVWKNRMEGVELGVWHKDYNNTVTGESGWEYPEFKGYHSNFYWAVIENKEKPFALMVGEADVFLRLFTPEPPKGAYNEYTDGVFPNGDISVLHAISPIGTKFRPAEETGPMGRKNMVFYNRSAKNLHLSLWVDFDLED